MQRRVRTDMQRPVRRLSKSIPGTHGWCYLKDKTYYAYTKKESELLEKAYVSKCPSWILVIRETPYEVNFKEMMQVNPVSYTHLRAHETDSYLVCRLLLEKKKKKK
eukprot:TRINITY_DN3423_c0_g1_i3.p1 TRINITY_DN3423_c0_g1~~TRINITY_DN3423_c0_g1_i3.p1  ORF type:complete len:106 (+),score=20.14 TRINITY_DN3423_c0_g1_i3:94-411(+)